jgi:hypothetical protein
MAMQRERRKKGEKKKEKLKKIDNGIRQSNIHRHNIVPLGGPSHSIADHSRSRGGA